MPDAELKAENIKGSPLQKGDYFECIGFGAYRCVVFSRIHYHPVRHLIPSTKIKDSYVFVEKDLSRIGKYLGNFLLPSWKDV